MNDQKKILKIVFQSFLFFLIFFNLENPRNCFSLIFNVYNEIMFTIEIEDEREAP